MANLTLSIDDTILEEARKAAARNGTTVNAIVREHLARLATRESRIERARRRLADLAERSTAQVGPRDWSREDLYDRGHGARTHG
jgi:hypothetical protein